MRLVVREMQGGDRRFVVSTFADSLRGTDSAGPIPIPWCSRVLEQVADEWILARPGLRVLVAHWSGATLGVADLVGWAAVERDYYVPSKVRRDGKWCKRLVRDTETPYVVYAYVKQGYRRSGIARALLKRAGVELDQPFRYALKTPAAKEMRLPCATHVPSILRFPKEAAIGRQENDDAAA